MRRRNYSSREQIPGSNHFSKTESRLGRDWPCTSQAIQGKELRFRRSISRGITRFRFNKPTNRMGLKVAAPFAQDMFERSTNFDKTSSPKKINRVGEEPFFHEAIDNEVANLQALAGYPNDEDQVSHERRNKFLRKIFQHERR